MVSCMLYGVCSGAPTGVAWVWHGMDTDDERVMDDGVLSAEKYSMVVVLTNFREEADLFVFDESAGGPSSSFCFGYLHTPA